ACVGAARAWDAVDADETRRAEAARALPGPSRCTGRAVVASSPVRIRGAPRWDAEVALADCEGVPTSWRGRATLYGGPEGPARGDEVEIAAQLAPPQRMWNADLDDPRPAQARRGVLRSGGVLDARVLRPARTPTAWIDRARAHVRARIDATFP